MPKAWTVRLAAVLISMPLLAEVVRKYIYPSNAVIALSEALSVLTAVVIFVRQPIRAEMAIGGGILILSAWGLFTVALGHQNLMLGLVGLRGFVVPSAFLLIGLAIFRALGAEVAAALLYRAFSVWMVIIGSVALMQLVAGTDHWLNVVPEGLGDGWSGLGDYTAGEVGLDYLFRPTSVFLHTGKFGVVVFILASYRVMYSFWIRRSSLQIARGVMLDCAVLLLSGQRAAWAGYAFVVTAGVIAIARRPGAAKLVVGMFVLAALGAGMYGSRLLEVGGEVGVFDIVAARAASVIPDSVVRLSENVIQPAGYVLERYAISLVGWGAFSLGSGVFGGRPLYEVVPIGVAENSWLRILAEQGIVGLLLHAAFVSSLVGWSVLSWRRRGVGWHRLSPGRGRCALLVLCPGIVLLVLFLWANTHDVLGNTVAMALCMTLFGTLTGGRCKRVCVGDASAVRAVESKPAAPRAT